MNVELMVIITGIFFVYFDTQQIAKANVQLCKSYKERVLVVINYQQFTI